MMLFYQRRDKKHKTKDIHQIIIIFFSRVSDFDLFARQKRTTWYRKDAVIISFESPPTLQY